MPAAPATSVPLSVTVLPAPTDMLPVAVDWLPMIRSVAETLPPAVTPSEPAAASPTIRLPPMVQVEAGPVTLTDEPSVPVSAAMSAAGPE